MNLLRRCWHIRSYLHFLCVPSKAIPHFRTSTGARLTDFSLCKSKRTPSLYQTRLDGFSRKTSEMNPFGNLQRPAQTRFDKSTTILQRGAMPNGWESTREEEVRSRNCFRDGIQAASSQVKTITSSFRFVSSESFPENHL